MKGSGQEAGLRSHDEAGDHSQALPRKQPHPHWQHLREIAAGRLQLQQPNRATSLTRPLACHRRRPIPRQRPHPRRTSTTQARSQPPPTNWQHPLQKKVRRLNQTLLNHAPPLANRLAWQVGQPSCTPHSAKGRNHCQSLLTSQKRPADCSPLLPGKLVWPTDGHNARPNWPTRPPAACYENGLVTSQRSAGKHVCQPLPSRNVDTARKISREITKVDRRQRPKLPLNSGWNSSPSYNLLADNGNLTILLQMAMRLPITHRPSELKVPQPVWLCWLFSVRAMTITMKNTNKLCRMVSNS